MIESNEGQDVSFLVPEAKEIPTLRPGVYLVEGIKRAALYDTNTGNVYSLNQEAVMAIKERDDDPEFRAKLTALQLAASGLEAKPMVAETEVPRPTLQFAWLEITNQCNEKCLHCYGSFSSVGEKETGQSLLSYADWENVILSLASNGCRQIQFIGGEPFKYRGAIASQTVLSLAGFARNQGVEFIEVFTNGTLISEEDVKEMKKLNVQVAVSIYSSVPEVHDKVTQVQGSYKKTLKSIYLLLEAGVSVRAAVVVMKQNEDTIEETLEMISKLGLNMRGPDIVRPSGRGQNLEIVPDAKTLLKYGLVTKPNFLTDPISFCRNHLYHNCLAGKIAITAEGKIIPCIFSRGQVMGDIKTQELSEILHSQQINEKWGLTKDNVLVCKDCEYRYACFDCRPLAEGSGCGSYVEAPFPRCTYNPYLGEWGLGIWKINYHGEIVYEQLPIT